MTDIVLEMDKKSRSKVVELLFKSSFTWSVREDKSIVVPVKAVVYLWINGVDVVINIITRYPANLKVFRGESNSASKLTEKDVIEIREKFIPRKYTRKDLAEEYGVTEACIKDVILRKSWRHMARR